MSLSDESLVMINGTIVSTRGFNCHKSCVSFYIESHKTWSFVTELNESSFYGMTHKCCANGNDVSLFSTPFQIQIKLNETNVLEDLRPILYFKVLSFDYWNRLISESYGFAELPVRPGRHSLVINTWKPYADNRLDKMRQYFTGCAPLVHHLHKDSTQPNNKCTNNYGLNSESSGSVALDIDVLIQNQSRQIVAKTKYQIKSSSLDSMKQNILSVVLAFQRAKKRMDYLRTQLNDTNHY
ncbi:unnamed protein product [Oppiella nova]|uniref:Uncharacterized protein n=1 Tax=Oppiella nova TaxID=334625 RepID=A0A7R9LDW6_9ACAR|nr:unnamed protein product [Oppiella nova]CAG2162093.1 unnamed protein product [Oppiella nova]